MGKRRAEAVDRQKGYALAEAVSVCGGDVYVVGNVYDADRRHSKATVWKNGVPQVLETGEAASFAGYGDGCFEWRCVCGRHCVANQI